MAIKVPALIKFLQSYLNTVAYDAIYNVAMSLGGKKHLKNSSLEDFYLLKFTEKPRCN